jgi:hypothetical protein
LFTWRTHQATGDATFEIFRDVLTIVCQGLQAGSLPSDRDSRSVVERKRRFVVDLQTWQRTAPHILIFFDESNKMLTSEECIGVDNGVE